MFAFSFDLYAYEKVWACKFGYRQNFIILNIED